MDLLKLEVRLVRSLLSFVIFALIFAFTIDSEQETSKQVLFEVLYEHGSGPVKQDTLAQIQLVCSNILNDEEVIDMYDVCTKPEIKQQLIDTCDSYQKLKEIDLVEVRKDLEETCSDEFFATLDESCEAFAGQPELDDHQIQALCIDYQQGLLSDEEFFGGFMKEAVPSIPVGLSEIEKVEFVLIIALVFILTILMVLHKGHTRALFTTLGRVFFQIGMYLLITLLLLQAYIFFVEPNTDPVLISLSDPVKENAEALLPIMISVVPFMIEQFFSGLHWLIAFIGIMWGIIFKIIGHKEHI